MDTGRDANIDVLPSDQTQINRYALLAGRLPGLEARAEEIKRGAEERRDALGELELMDAEDTVGYSRRASHTEKHNLCRFRIGECIQTVSVQDAVGRLGEEISAHEARLASANEEIGAVEREMAVLKASLYAKFKDSINLEK